MMESLMKLDTGGSVKMIREGIYKMKEDRGMRKKGTLYSVKKEKGTLFYTIGALPDSGIKGGAQVRWIRENMEFVSEQI